MFDIIVEPNRRAILSLLAASEQSVGEIERQLGMPQPTVSKHLRVLRDAGFVEATVDAQRRRYRLNPEPLEELEVCWHRSAALVSSGMRSSATGSPGPDHAHRKSNSARTPADTPQDFKERRYQSPLFTGPPSGAGKELRNWTLSGEATAPFADKCGGRPDPARCAKGRPSTPTNPGPAGARPVEHGRSPTPHVPRRGDARRTPPSHVYPWGARHAWNSTRPTLVRTYANDQHRSPQSRWGRQAGTVLRRAGSPARDTRSSHVGMDVISSTAAAASRDTPRSSRRVPNWSSAPTDHARAKVSSSVSGHRALCLQLGFRPTRHPAAVAERSATLASRYFLGRARTVQAPRRDRAACAAPARSRMAYAASPSHSVRALATSRWLSPAAWFCRGTSVLWIISYVLWRRCRRRPRPPDHPRHPTQDFHAEINTSPDHHPRAISQRTPIGDCCDAVAGSRLDQPPSYVVARESWPFRGGRMALICTASLTRTVTLTSRGAFLNARRACSRRASRNVRRAIRQPRREKDDPLHHLVATRSPQPRESRRPAVEEPAVEEASLIPISPSRGAATGLGTDDELATRSRRPGRDLHPAQGCFRDAAGLAVDQP